MKVISRNVKESIEKDLQHFNKFDFDTVLNRRGTNSYKWDNAEVVNEKLLPLSVADMDFATPSEITQALVNRTQNPIYGYEFQPDALKEAIIAWESDRHEFEIHKDLEKLFSEQNPRLMLFVQGQN